MKFQINNNEWDIIEKESDVILKEYQEGLDDRATFAFGLTIFPKHEIWINKNMVEEQKIRTLKHELTHCFIYNYGLYNVPNFNEEMVCDLVASINDFINKIVAEYDKKADNYFWDDYERNIRNDKK